jgi:hypothetical protein
MRDRRFFSLHTGTVMTFGAYHGLLKADSIFSQSTRDRRKRVLALERTENDEFGFKNQRRNDQDAEHFDVNGIFARSFRINK